MSRRGAIAGLVAGALVALALLLVGLLTDPARAAAGNFWLELRRCESSDGALSPNLYQFTAETGAKVGLPDPGAASPARQLEAAQEWAARIHPNEATRAGWPTCWRVALAASGTGPGAAPAPASSAPRTRAPAPEATVPPATAGPATPSPPRSIALTG